MQMNEQVLTALEVLRNFAENDFELHRIDVLEKFLTMKFSMFITWI